MADLSVDFAGLKLHNPVIISSAGITENVRKMRLCQENGAAAVVIKSYFEEAVCRQDPSPRYHMIHHDMGGDKTFSFFSYEQASEWSLDRYAEEVASAKAELDIKIIPSINCITDDGWVEAARAMVDAGADAIEMNTSCPHGSITFRGGAVEEIIGNTVRRVREAVPGIPLIAKISPMLTSPLALVQALHDVGVDGFTIFNRMTALDIDLDTEAPIMHGGYAGHGGPWAIQYPLRWISQITRTLPVQIAGSGGVVAGGDAAKFILAGAQVVQVCSAVVLNGYGVIREIVDGLNAYMDAKGHANLAQMRGVAARKIVGADQVDRTKKLVAFIHKELHAPCVNACPAHVPAQAYVHLIAQGDFAGALEAIRSAGPLQGVCGWVCYHPCETACVRGRMDDPIAIRALKRFAIEWGRKHAPLSELSIEKAPPTGKRVAVVGAGPAGLIAAFDLAKLGHEVTIFEADAMPGGMLRWAVPRYRLPEDVLDEEIDYVRRAGVDIQCGKRLGRDFSLDDLRSSSDAIVMSIGAGLSATLGVPGEDADGVQGALGFLRRAHSCEEAVGPRVAVVGGGNTALDAARTALRRGAEEVYVVYRRSRAEMPAGDEEVALAEEEGVRILYLAVPVAVEEKGGKVTGLRVRAGYLDKPGADRRRAPVGLPGAEYVLDVDRVVLAVSQIADPNAAVQALNDFGFTALPGVFIAGDMAGDSGTVIHAIASARRAALGVDCFLKGQGADEAAERWGGSVPADARSVLKRSIDRDPADRVDIPHRDPGERVGDFNEVELTLTQEQAVREADRCLRCGCGVGCAVCYKVCPYFAIEPDGYGFRVDAEKCSGCGMCIIRCPNANIDEAPLPEGDR